MSEIDCDESPRARESRRLQAILHFLEGGKLDPRLSSDTGSWVGPRLQVVRVVLDHLKLNATEEAIARAKQLYLELHGYSWIEPSAGNHGAALVELLFEFGLHCKPCFATVLSSFGSIHWACKQAYDLIARSNLPQRSKIEAWTVLSKESWHRDASVAQLFSAELARYALDQPAEVVRLIIAEQALGRLSCLLVENLATMLEENEDISVANRLKGLCVLETLLDDGQLNMSWSTYFSLTNNKRPQWVDLDRAPDRFALAARSHRAHSEALILGLKHIGSDAKDVCAEIRRGRLLARTLLRQSDEDLTRSIELLNLAGFKSCIVDRLIELADIHQTERVAQVLCRFDDSQLVLSKLEAALVIAERCDVRPLSALLFQLVHNPAAYFAKLSVLLATRPVVADCVHHHESPELRSELENKLLGMVHEYHHQDSLNLCIALNTSNGDKTRVVEALSSLMNSLLDGPNSALLVAVSNCLVLLTSKREMLRRLAQGLATDLTGRRKQQYYLSQVTSMADVSAQFKPMDEAGMNLRMTLLIGFDGQSWTFVDQVLIPLAETLVQRGNIADDEASWITALFESCRPVLLREIDAGGTEERDYAASLLHRFLALGRADKRLRDGINDVIEGDLRAMSFFKRLQPRWRRVTKSVCT